MNNKLTYISLFSSAGIGCYGFKREGFECIATCELISSRMDIQKANNKCKYDSGYIVGDLTSAETKEKLFDEVKKWETTEGLDSIDVVVATPPCQGMSTANYKKGDESKRNSLVVEAISIINQLHPKIFVFENVKAFLKTDCTDINGDIVTIKESIQRNLGEEYYIYSRVINFKDYGVPSSRPRTIVIGTKKEFLHFSPLNIFPMKESQITVRDAIGDLPSLSFGEISNDIFHFFREYPRYMEDWISNISEGESAFNNDEDHRPFKLNKDGEKKLLKGAHLGNKFRRLFWDRPGACIATRNDQLASQDTIHPSDNRVLSIRELMRLMTIPDEFCWSTKSVDALKGLDDKKEFLRENELNIRRCIGEAVPTHIMQTIAKHVKEMLAFQKYVENYYSNKNTVDDKVNSFYRIAFDFEMQLNDVKKTGSYYTPQSVVFETISTINLEGKKDMNILEPSVGMGAFLPQMFRLCDACDNVNIDLCDIDEETIKKLKTALKKVSYNKNNIKLKFICQDFLTSTKLRKKYDLIVSNPPFAKCDGNKIKEYRNMHDVGKSDNLFSFFLEKFRNISDEIAVIIPKSFIMAVEYNKVRKAYEFYGIKHVVDYGVKYFKEVFVEILSFHFKKNYKEEMLIENKLSNENIIQKQGYIYHDKSWLLYRNQWFDNYIKTLKLDVFDAIRDRQLTNKKVKDSGEIWVLRSKNILDTGEIIHKDGYDKFIDCEELESFRIAEYINSNAIIMPSFTYLTRASRLPKNCIPNGSIAILIPKEITNDIDLSLYATDDFRRYYEIVKNKAKFTLNIDANSVYYIGVRI